MEFGSGGVDFVWLECVRVRGMHNVITVAGVGDSTIKYYLQALETVLPRFNGLETIFATCNPEVYDEDNISVLDSDFETARIWGRSVPTSHR
ncbi:hypothetical protein JAAARDRAFT_322407 [Jaapia argillacea MUCL 33604]|uniref:Uncharacterized protein n=1 Tax=Jaapia argillacea MUCL 33604 TaxID=933084 RepID=A0A067PN01_9AGAM|nr:hypothetical protein JAAARDRAFT_322407 [Jaapia argillacea MUCL 33604]